MDKGIIAKARKDYLEGLCESKVLCYSGKNNVPSIADKDSKESTRLSVETFRILENDLGLDIPHVNEKLAGQTAGKIFEEATRDYLQSTFTHMNEIRPGRWAITRYGNRSKTNISIFTQYKHLAALDDIAKDDDELRAALGNDYLITPDVVIGREPVMDAEINAREIVVDPNGDLARHSDIRNDCNDTQFLHASISAKLTMRTDRAQNARSEALSFIRNRKGRLPHIVVVTAEPFPTRLASIALGTGDLDCVYHCCFNEWVKAVNAVGSEASIDMLNTLISGNRLKDISDLPLDLSV